MRFSVLASSSRGSCTYLEACGTRLVIDCGLSAAQAERRLAALGVDAAKLDAILVTHEHRDHIHGVSTLSRRFSLPVYANRETAAFINGAFGVEKFSSGTPFAVGALEIQPFRVTHDAADPVGFVVCAGELRFALATDLGRVTTLVRAAMGGCRAVVIEANHDEDLLLACDYPWQLKQRILSPHGHLSNKSAGALLAEVCHPELEVIVLGHISENSNSPALARQTVGCYLARRYSDRLYCASAYAATPLFELGSAALLSNQAQNLLG